MSFILDALKKSELERQRQSIPGLLDARIEPRRSRLSLWAIGLAVLLGINLLVLMFVLLKKGTSPSAQPPVASAAVAGDVVPAAAAPPADAHFSPLDTAPVYAPEIAVAPTQSAAEPAAAARGTPGSGPGPGRSVPRLLRRPDPVLSDAQTNAETQEVLPSLSEVSLSGAQSLPELHLDVHVYATKPADRFVYINMRKYHEGTVLQEGPTVERIRRDGVVLNYQGLRFILPRQP